MSHRMKVTIYPCDQSALCEIDYDIAMVSSGYESRGRFAWDKLALKAQKKIAFLFPTHAVLDYEANRTFFSQRGFDMKAPTWKVVHETVSDLCGTEDTDG